MLRHWLSKWWPRPPTRLRDPSTGEAVQAKEQARNGQVQADEQLAQALVEKRNIAATERAVQSLAAQTNQLSRDVDRALRSRRWRRLT